MKFHRLFSIVGIMFSVNFSLWAQETDWLSEIKDPEEWLLGELLEQINPAHPYARGRAPTPAATALRLPKAPGPQTQPSDLRKKEIARVGQRRYRQNQKIKKSQADLARAENVALKASIRKLLVERDAILQTLVKHFKAQ